MSLSRVALAGTHCPRCGVPWPDLSVREHPTAAVSAGCHVLCWTAWVLTGGPCHLGALGQAQEPAEAHSGTHTCCVWRAGPTRAALSVAQAGNHAPDALPGAGRVSVWHPPPQVLPTEGRVLWAAACAIEGRLRVLLCTVLGVQCAPDCKASCCDLAVLHQAAMPPSVQAFRPALYAS